MSWMQFTVDLVRALAWPGVVLTLAIVLRRPIGRLVGQRLTSIEGLGVRAEFDRVRREVRAEVEEITEGIRQPLPSSPGVTTLDPELATVARADPRAAVAAAFAAVEADLRRRLSADDEDADTAMSGMRLATTAAETGVITPASLEAARGLAVLRNLAEHGEVTIAQAIDYLALADAVLYSFRLSGQAS